MNVIITQRQKKDQYGQLTDSLESAYTSYFTARGIQLIPISNSIQNVTEYLKNFDFQGIILSGGGDIDPSLYDGDLQTDLSTSKDRDRLERELVDFALQNNIPVLGVCRGMQFLNVYFGGGLVQDLTTVDASYLPVGDHGAILSLSHIREKLENEDLKVNSYHRSGITKKELSPQLKAFVVHQSLGLVEGFYHESHPIIGIQWHPERSDTSAELDELLLSYFMNGKVLNTK